MEARLKLTRSVARQESTYTKILKWMQDNPGRCRNTNVSLLGRCMASEVGVSVQTCKQYIQKMVNVQMVSRFGTKRNSQFLINYLHKDTPATIIENAPAEAKALVERIKAGMKPGQYLDSVGCVVTPAQKKNIEKPTAKKVRHIKVVDKTPKKTNIPVKFSSNASEENTMVPVKVRQSADGLSISITLNININK